MSHSRVQNWNRFGLRDATLRQVEFDRREYTANGSGINLASRLCDERREKISGSGLKPSTGTGRPVAHSLAWARGALLDEIWYQFENLTRSLRVSVTFSVRLTGPPL